jgi:hypothetical protein
MVDRCSKAVRRSSADSVEKLGRGVPRCTAAKIDLSDRPRIDDRDPGNGLTTPANVRKRAPLEFFNRIGQDQPFGAEAEFARNGRSQNRGNMTPTFTAALSAKLEEYRAWAVSRPDAAGRLVMYEGVQFMSAIDVLHDELEAEVEGLFCSGYRVDWSEHLGRIYLVAWEEAGPVLPWAPVYAEKDLVDIQALLADRNRR